MYFLHVWAYFCAYQVLILLLFISISTFSYFFLLCLFLLTLHFSSHLTSLVFNIVFGLFFCIICIAICFFPPSNGWHLNNRLIAIREWHSDPLCFAQDRVFPLWWTHKSRPGRSLICYRGSCCALTPAASVWISASDDSKPQAELSSLWVSCRLGLPANAWQLRALQQRVVIDHAEWPSTGSTRFSRNTGLSKPGSSIWCYSFVCFSCRELVDDETSGQCSPAPCGRRAAWSSGPPAARNIWNPDPCITQDNSG